MSDKEKILKPRDNLMGYCRISRKQNSAQIREIREFEKRIFLGENILAIK